MEKLAVGSVDQADEDDLSDEPEIGLDEANSVDDSLELLLKNAETKGFPANLMPSLRTTVLDFTDVWRARLGCDGPARATPYSVKLKPNATPFRCKPRRYPIVVDGMACFDVLNGSMPQSGDLIDAATIFSCTCGNGAYRGLQLGADAQEEGDNFGTSSRS
ncbi:hypothetical protein PI124_g15849 [Phytophthora idaei]|nr:hypothetical protein PI124_g15849 [Phytophthora idaei]